MLANDLQNKDDNLLRYRERLSNFSKEFEVGLFIYLLRKSLIYILLIDFLIGFLKNPFCIYDVLNVGFCFFIFNLISKNFLN